MSKVTEYIKSNIQYLEILWIALFIGTISFHPCFADTFSPTFPILKMEKELVYKPNAFILKVEQRFKELGYNQLGAEYPQREETMMKLKYLVDKINSSNANLSLTDEDFRETWKKESSVVFLTNLYYWLHGDKVVTSENGLDDAWYLISTNSSGFEKSLHSLLK